MKKLYYNEMKCADPEYLSTDGYQGDIDRDLAKSNSYNRKEDELEMKSKERTVHMKKLS